MQVLAVNILGRFLLNSDKNIRYAFKKGALCCERWAAFEMLELFSIRLCFAWPQLIKRLTLLLHGTVMKAIAVWYVSHSGLRRFTAYLV